MIKVNNLKYFVFIGLFCCSFNVFSQENFEEVLNLGIEKSDIGLVVKSLSKVELNDEDKEKFLKIARERVKYRIKMLEVEFNKYFEEKTKESAKAIRIFFYSGCICLGLSFYFAGRDSYIGTLGSSLATIISFSYLKKYLSDNRKKLYQNSIEIIDLIISA